MRFLIALFLISLEGSRAFSPSPTIGSHPAWISSNTAKKQTADTLASSTEDSDQYDSWYDDFDPSQFDGYNQEDSFVEHDYTRDTSMDNSNIDLAEVNRLISERVEMKKTRRFNEADAIRDELLDKHGVMVRDRERMWRSGCSASGSGGRWANDRPPRRLQPFEKSPFSPDSEDDEKVQQLVQDRDNARANRDFELADSIRDELRTMNVFVDDRKRQWTVGQGQRSSRTRDFGPNGHDYNLAADAGPNQSSLSEPEIHEKLAARLQAKLNRDYTTSDMIQGELLSAGVALNDKEREWRADGGVFDEFKARSYTQSEFSEPTENVEEIQTMVDDRAKAKAERLYRKADEIRDVLLHEFQVTIDDKLNEWSIGGNFGVQKEFRPFEKAPFSGDTEDDDKIQQLVDQRDIARANRNFEEADAIREELSQMNVVVNDRKRQWSTGNRRSSRISQDFGPNGHDYQLVADAGPNQSTLSDQEIHEMLATRLECKLNRDYMAADKIQERLQSAGVSVNDKTKEWRADGVSEALYSCQDGGSLSETDIQVINDLLEKRYEHKQNRKYKSADKIRDELFDTFKVQIDDKGKEWYVV